VALEKKLVLAVSFFILVNAALLFLFFSLLWKFYSLSKAGVVSPELLLLGFGAGVAIAFALLWAARLAPRGK
jgi:hypothetical protein